MSIVLSTRVPDDFGADFYTWAAFANQNPTEFMKSALENHIEAQKAASFDTSRESYHELAPATQMTQVLDTLRKHGPLADYEIRKITGLAYNVQTARRRQLVIDGKVSVESIKVNTGTGKKVKVWRVV